ncbi:hypothetical protein ACFOD1_10540 [Pseudidiomarina halophila]|uniref:hypothetical protein n=1 Tax=Pseudidiomarina halophila TaxID=1449799 RepID=UPI000F864C56|nr:hypothetical protein [Pseudidiomarina halophila]
MQRATSHDSGYQAASSAPLAVLPVPNNESDSDADLTLHSAITAQPVCQSVVARHTQQQLRVTYYLVPQPRAPPSHA